jgi:hypothetical protein
MEQHHRWTLAGANDVELDPVAIDPCVRLRFCRGERRVAARFERLAHVDPIFRLAPGMRRQLPMRFM